MKLATIAIQVHHIKSWVPEDGCHLGNMLAPNPPYALTPYAIHGKPCHAPQTTLGLVKRQMAESPCASGARQQRAQCMQAGNADAQRRGVASVLQRRVQPRACAPARAPELSVAQEQVVQRLARLLPLRPRADDDRQRATQPRDHLCICVA